MGYCLTVKKQEITVCPYYHTVNGKDDWGKISNTTYFSHHVYIFIIVRKIFSLSASYLDLHLEIDSEWRLRTKLYDKRDDFNFRGVGRDRMVVGVLITYAISAYHH